MDNITDPILILTNGNKCLVCTEFLFELKYFSRADSYNRSRSTGTKQRDRADEERADSRGVDHQEGQVSNFTGAHVLEDTQAEDA